MVEAQAEVAEVQAEQERPQPPVQPQPQPQPAQALPEPQAAQQVQAAQPVAEITRMCAFCFTQQPLSQLDDLGPLQRRCKDAAGCAQRAAASGFYPQDERALEQDLASFETRQGALR